AIVPCRLMWSNRPGCSRSKRPREAFRTTYSSACARPAGVNREPGPVQPPSAYSFAHFGSGIGLIFTPGILFRVLIRPSLKMSLITNFTGFAAMPLSLSHCFLMLSTPVLNLSFRPVTMSPNLSNTGLMCLLYTFTILSFIQDHLLPIQVKISRSFSHNQVATDLTRSHVGLRYFSQASLIPRTISSQ